MGEVGDSSVESYPRCQSLPLNAVDMACDMAGCDGSSISLALLLSLLPRLKGRRQWLLFLMLRVPPFYCLLRPVRAWALTAALDKAVQSAVTQPAPV